mgnify:CR=1 FL=1
MRPGVRGRGEKNLCAGLWTSAEKSRRAYHFAPRGAEKHRLLYQARCWSAERFSRPCWVSRVFAEKNRGVYQESRMRAEKVLPLYQGRSRSSLLTVQSPGFLGAKRDALVRPQAFLGIRAPDMVRLVAFLGAHPSRAVHPAAFLGVFRGKVVRPSAFLSACLSGQARRVSFLGMWRALLQS